MLHEYSALYIVHNSHFARRLKNPAFPITAKKTANARPARNGDGQKKSWCILVLPKGAGQTPGTGRRSHRTHSTTAERGYAKAVTAYVTLAYNVNCRGNANRLRRVKCKA